MPQNEDITGKDLPWTHIQIHKQIKLVTSNNYVRYERAPNKYRYGKITKVTNRHIRAYFADSIEAIPLTVRTTTILKTEPTIKFYIKPEYKIFYKSGGDNSGGDNNGMD